MKLHVLGIDIGKTVFHLAGMDESGKILVKKRCSRSQLLHYTANLSINIIGMEACSGAHFLARELSKQGHEVRLMPAQYVKPFVKTNKNDFNDAVAIAEAVQRPTMRFVPMLHRAIYMDPGILAGGIPRSTLCSIASRSSGGSSRASSKR